MSVELSSCHKRDRKCRQYFLRRQKVNRFRFCTFPTNCRFGLMGIRNEQVWIWKETPFEWKKQIGKLGSKSGISSADKCQNFLLSRASLQWLMYLGKVVSFTILGSDSAIRSAYCYQSSNVMSNLSYYSNRWLKKVFTLKS